MAASRRKKRYLGMTVIQLIVLGCLVVAACGTIGAGVWLVTSSLSSGGVGLVAPAPVQPTATFPPPEPAATATATLVPTQTPIPYESLIPDGWEQYRTDKIEIWLPPDYQSEDVGVGLRNAIQTYKDLGRDDLAQKLENGPPAYELWFNNRNPATGGFKTSVTVSSVLMSGNSLDEYLDELYFDLTMDIHVVDRRVFKIQNYEARRTTIETAPGSLDIITSEYAIADGTFVWFITCTATLNDFYTLQPTFDQIARTFRFVAP